MHLNSFCLSITIFFSFVLFQIDEVQSITELTLAERLCNKETDEFCTYYGYTAEIYHVTTEDGYILTLFRCTNKTASSNGRVVILQHGVLTCSDDYVMNIPSEALDQAQIISPLRTMHKSTFRQSYIMADNGYDVWLPNFRGNYYSRHHVSKDPNNAASGFWKFSWDLVGYRDYPAIFNYIRNKTGVSKLYLVAHSMGTSSLMALLSEYPEYNEYFHAVSFLAPIGYLYHATIQFQILGLLGGPLEILENEEFLPRTPLSDVLGTVCGLGNESAVCNLVVDLFYGPSNDKNQTLLPTFLCHVPAGASTNELLHFAEEIRKYIFGEWKSKSDFPLHKMTVPLSLYWSIYDDFTNEKDVNRLISHLNNTIDLRVKRITLKYFDHQDFVWGSSASKLIYPDILEFFDKHAQS